MLGLNEGVGSVTPNVEMASRRNDPTKSETFPNVFEFLDYRAYLRAYYGAAKRSRAGFSFRTFSKRAGLKSPNFFKLVMDGERNLGPDTVTKFADALRLEEAERAFFADLVAFAQAPSSVEKSRAFERLAASRRFRSARRIDGMVLSYLSQWYHPAVRELAARRDFVAEPAWVACRLRPSITPAQAAESLRLLGALGLLVRDQGTGRLVRGEPTLTTEHEVSALGAASFHRQMMQRASEGIDQIPRALRDLAALTVCISAETAQEVKERIHKFRESLAELCDADTEGRIVYQLNVQWFPLSRGDEDK